MDVPPHLRKPIDGRAFSEILGRWIPRGAWPARGPDRARQLAPPMLETQHRRCPACESEQILHAGTIISAKSMLKAEYRCETCGVAFLLARVREQAVLTVGKRYTA